MSNGHSDSGAKNPVFVSAGRRGANKRWAGHTPASVKLDALTNPQRRLVLALVAAEAARNEAAQSEAATGRLDSPVAADAEEATQNADPAA